MSYSFLLSLFLSHFVSDIQRCVDCGRSRSLCFSSPFSPDSIVMPTSPTSTLVRSRRLSDARCFYYTRARLIISRRGKLARRNAQRRDETSERVFAPLLACVCVVCTRVLTPQLYKICVIHFSLADGSVTRLEFFCATDASAKRICDVL